MAQLQRRTCEKLAKAHQHERSYIDTCALCEWASMFCAKAMVVHWATTVGVDAPCRQYPTPNAWLNCWVQPTPTLADSSSFGIYCLYLFIYLHLSAVVLAELQHRPGSSPVVEKVEGPISKINEDKTERFAAVVSFWASLPRKCRYLQIAAVHCAVPNLPFTCCCFSHLRHHVQHECSLREPLALFNTSI